MRIVFVLLQLMAALQRSVAVTAIAAVLLGLSIWRWTHAMSEWQDHRDGFRYYDSREAIDVPTAELDARSQAIMDQCKFDIEFKAEKRDSKYHEEMAAKCSEKIASYKRVAVKKTGDKFVVRAKIKCLCGPVH